ncbi:MAG: ABC transporter permease subunit [Clostridia bacterium]|nr:ABC transporter permease subunit [Clostridia bacterium]
MVTVAEVFTSLFEGFVVSVEIFLLTLLFAIPLGLIISFGSMSKFKPLKYVVKFFIWVIRGTPLMLQLIVIFYGPGLIADWATNTGSSNPVIMWLASWTVMERFSAVIISLLLTMLVIFPKYSAVV